MLCDVPVCVSTSKSVALYVCPPVLLNTIEVTEPVTVSDPFTVSGPVTVLLCVDALLMAAVYMLPEESRGSRIVPYTTRSVRLCRAPTVNTLSAIVLLNEKVAFEALTAVFDAKADVDEADEADVEAIDAAADAMFAVPTAWTAVARAFVAVLDANAREAA